MGWTYRIDKEKGTVFSTEYDVLTETDLLKHRNFLLRDPDFDPSFNQLLDLSQVTNFAVSIEFAQKDATQTVFSGSSKRAIVAPRGREVEGLEIYRAWHAGLPGEVAVFDDREEAKYWLNVD